jgi:hypothetical protein
MSDSQLGFCRSTSSCFHQLTIGVTGTIDVGVVTVLGLVLDVLPHQSLSVKERAGIDVPQWRW